ncbi:hypothetical protein BE221DRAFT_72140 [Ostreococcus tauri]|uniref:Uncharacterized protein n=1 Tax=Ostreococcus tauri TaxID=70448 RepID=A0A1Y5IDI2_OSTTA|nr:hypothetical protein BE221DRAFT_72140 [Ostreococcus tauri]
MTASRLAPVHHRSICVPKSRSRRRTKPRAADANDSLGNLDALLSGGITSEDERVVGPSSSDDEPTTSSGTQRVTRAVEVRLNDETVARVELEVTSATSRLVRATMKSPLGIVFEDVEGALTVVEFFDESDLGPRARGIRIGDVLRATSAMIPEMQYPKLNVLGGGVGRPGWRRVMYTTACDLDGNLDDVTFDQAMKAIGSNAKAGDYDVELVFERRATD